MSRGLGHVQQKVSAAVADEPKLAYGCNIDALCERVYRGINRVEKKHRVAISRALKRLKLFEKVPTQKRMAQDVKVSERFLRMMQELRLTGRDDLFAQVAAGTMKLHAALAIAKPESYGRTRIKRNSTGNRIANLYIRATVEERREFEKMLQEVEEEHEKEILWSLGLDGYRDE